jgi:hypothetical protein
MCTIYRGSSLTLAATIAPEGSAATAPSDCCGQKFELRNSSNESWEFCVRETINHQGFSTDPSHFDIRLPLLKRAWVFQERLLAPRYLNFSQSELVWECANGTVCECSEF